MSTKFLQFITKSDGEILGKKEDLQSYLDKGYTIVNLQSFPFQTQDKILTQVVLNKSDSSPNREQKAYVEAAKNLSKMDTIGSMDFSISSLLGAMQMEKVGEQL